MWNVKNILDQVENGKGKILTHHGHIIPCTKFEMEIYVLMKDKSYIHTEFFNEYCPHFYFRMIDVIGGHGIYKFL
jgi:translation elongation factor EF-Tu-like GTPase